MCRVFFKLFAKPTSPGEEKNRYDLFREEFQRLKNAPEEVAVNVVFDLVGWNK